MAANTNPIFTLTPNVGPASFAVLLTAANTAMDGTGTVNTVFTAGANGALVNRVRFKFAPGTGTSVATVARIFINNGGTNATATNNILWDEVTLPITTGSQTTANPFYEVLLNIALPAGYKINVTLGTAPASSTGWYCCAVGGDY